MGGQTKDEEMGRTCGTYVGEEKYSYKLKESDNLDDLGVDGRVISEWILKLTVWKGMDWTDLAEDKGKCWAVVKTVMNIPVP